MERFGIFKQEVDTVLYLRGKHFRIVKDERKHVQSLRYKQCPEFDLLLNRLKKCFHIAAQRGFNEWHCGLQVFERGKQTFYLMTEHANLEEERKVYKANWFFDLSNYGTDASEEKVASYTKLSSYTDETANSLTAEPFLFWCSSFVCLQANG